MESIDRLGRTILYAFFLLVPLFTVAAERGDDVTVSADSVPLYGIVNLSVCNLHDKADWASEMVTQGLLGMPVRVLQHGGRWICVTLPDGYTAWVHEAGIRLVTCGELAAWNAAEKIVATAHYGFVYSQPDLKAQTLSDVVAGCRLKWTGTRGAFYRVAYPDGREGYIPKSLSMPEKKWRGALRRDAAGIVGTAYTLMGIPYLWAGTSSKGVDCSGLVRTVLFMHDVIMPRNASQQARVGRRIDIAPDFSNLQEGDLIFFGLRATDGQPERVTHVGIYIGNRRFIHSQGDVHIGSLDPDDALFDDFNFNRLLFATRFLPYINKEKEINTTETNPYYQTNCQIVSPCR